MSQDQDHDGLRRPVPRANIPDVVVALKHVEDVCRSMAADYGPGHYFHVHRVRYAYTLLEMSRLSRFERPIEIGSDGLFLRLARDLFGSRNPVGVTYSSEGAKSFLGPVPDRFQFLAGDIETDALLAPDGAFDLVICGEIIEHMPRDPMAMLSEINRLLSVGGRLLLTTPNVTSFRNIKFALDGIPPMNFYQFRRSGSLDRHHFEYTPTILSGLITAAGFEVELLDTKDCWSAPDPALVSFMERNGYDMALRRDNIFVVARKVGPVRERFPDILYVD